MGKEDREKEGGGAKRNIGDKLVHERKGVKKGVCVYLRERGREIKRGKEKKKNRV